MEPTFKRKELAAGTDLELRQRPTIVPKPYASKDEYHAWIDAFHERLRGRQELLYADGRFALLIVLQGMDTSGKDGIIRHVMSGVNPQGCEVTSFKQPSSEERRHDFLWRASRQLPQRGWIGIFNRSYYEDVLITRVHPELLDNEPGPPKAHSRSESWWKHRFESIRAFEEHLTRSGTVIVKIYLHLSKEEQKDRLLARLDDDTKHWKLAPSDFTERRHFDAYVDAYEDCLRHTSTKDCPWYVVPADHKKTARVLVSRIIDELLEELPLRFPKPPVDRAELLALLEKEG